MFVRQIPFEMAFAFYISVYHPFLPRCLTLTAPSHSSINNWNVLVVNYQLAFTILPERERESITREYVENYDCKTVPWWS